MRVVQMKVENVKRLKCVNVTPQKYLVTVAGDNAEGKSSLIDSIFYAITGTKDIPAQPIRHGQESAVIKLDLGEVTVTRKFTQSGSTLVVEAASGARFPTPQKLLDSLYNNLSFDPLAFTRQPAKVQLETLKRLVKLDVDVDALDGLNAQDFEKRTEVNREVARLKAQISSIVIPETAKEDLSLDESFILKEMEEAAAHNQKWQAELSRRETYKKGLENAKAELVELESKAVVLRAKIESFIDDMAHWVEMPPPIALAELRAKAERARLAGQARRLLTQRDQWASALGEAVTQADSLTMTMSARLKSKENAIASAEMPIKGLTFGDDGVMYNGVPFEQCSQAEQLVVSTVIAIALNPKLRIIRVSDGSLLDSHNMELLAQIAEKYDAQIWCEVVSSSDPLAIHMVDGEATGSQSLGLPHDAEEVKV